MRTLGRQKGQVLLVVVLVIVIASTIGLSLASRSITNLRTSTEEAESQKALAAAEAGIERSLQSNLPVALPASGNNPYYSTTVESTSGNEFLIYGGGLVEKNEGADVWFVNHANGDPDYNNLPGSPPSDINLYWGLSDCSSEDKPAAIEAIVVTRNSSGVINSYRYAYDPCNRANNFTVAVEEKNTVPVTGGTEFRYKTPSNNLANGLTNIVLMRVIPIYKDTKVGITSGTGVFPTQGYRIDSTGKSGEANRKLWVYKGYPQTYLPYLSYGLFVAN